VTITNKCLIIGGNSGIGKTTAKVMAEKLGRDIHTPHRNELDVESSASVSTYIRTHGPFPYIVYSAGYNELAWVRDQNIDVTMEYLFSINCAGFVLTISEHLRIFPGEVMSAVAVSSDAARIPMRGSVAYCASKAALDMAVKVLARELAPLNRINAVAPGMVEDTPMTEYIDKTIPEFRGWTPEHAREYEEQNTPTGRRATRKEVAKTIAWVLTGPEQMTGAIIEINGGR
jgi:NAD(P)-dependent dehydrogenase (short-subunit alcohol dehydrogenase family)